MLEEKFVKINKHDVPNKNMMDGYFFKSNKRAAHLQGNLEYLARGISSNSFSACRLPICCKISFNHWFLRVLGIMGLSGIQSCL